MRPERVPGVQWVGIVSMPGIRLEHPEWTEDECRAEFNRRFKDRMQALTAKPKGLGW